MIIWASVSPSESLGAVRVCGLVCTVWFFTWHCLWIWSQNVPRIYTRALGLKWQLNKDVCVQRMLPMGSSVVCCWDEIFKNAKINEKKNNVGNSRRPGLLELWCKDNVRC